MRPTVTFLSDELVEQIVGETRSVLAEIGVEIHNSGVVSLLSDHGATVGADTNRVFLGDDVIDLALSTVPPRFQLYDALGRQAGDLGDDRVHFTPGSAAITVLDHGAHATRPPTTDDYVRYVKVASQLPHIDFQSTALVPSDVHQNISDSYRLYLGLLYCEKPVVTGAFTIEAFQIMRDLQVAVRGTRSRSSTSRCRSPASSRRSRWSDPWCSTRRRR